MSIVSENDPLLVEELPAFCVLKMTGSSLAYVRDFAALIFARYVELLALPCSILQVAAFLRLGVMASGLWRARYSHPRGPLSSEVRNRVLVTWCRLPSRSPHLESVRESSGCRWWSLCCVGESWGLLWVVRCVCVVVTGFFVRIFSLSA